jgi:hypothetical protein
MQSPAEPGFDFFGGSQSHKYSMFERAIAAFFRAVDACADRAHANRI